MIDSVANLIDALRRGRLLEHDQEQELCGQLVGRFAEPRALAIELVQRRWLTTYQVNELFQGRGSQLLLGNYVLLEKLGEGGMGIVFKARNWKLGRIVALKLMRKERLEKPDAVRRFHREIRAAARLDHPNIVRAFDADEVAGWHFFVMEFVEGTDLDRLVKKSGPLPVATARDYVRQAATGLQHAHENGFVHRDVKPSNLLLSQAGVVKILDMGLAKQTAGEEVSTEVTHEGTVMGTADYMAPEQARESATVDIRADLYSLGCTFYFLLARRVPFPGGTFIQKVNKQQFNEPVPIEQTRPDVPPGVAAVVRKLMAKDPADRFQTPAELIQALQGSATVAAPAPKGRSNPFIGLDFDTEVTPPPSAEPGRKASKGRRLVAAGLVVGLLLTAGVVAVTRPWQAPPTTEPDQVAQTRPKPAASARPVDDAWVKSVQAIPADEQAKAVEKKLRELNPTFTGEVKVTVEKDAVTALEFSTDQVADISPVRALAGLRDLKCMGQAGRLTDLSPLKGLPLKRLDCSNNPVADLSPLRDMPLAELAFANTKVVDLSPLRGLPLGLLNCSFTGVTDLTPVEDAPLTTLYCNHTSLQALPAFRKRHLRQLHTQHTPVSDLTPLLGQPLAFLDVSETHVRDLGPLRGLPNLTVLLCDRARVVDLSPLKNRILNALRCDFVYARDAEVLRSVKALTQVNGKPRDEFWKAEQANLAAFDAWLKKVAAMPPDDQVAAVAVELKKRNPNFEGQVTPSVEGGTVTELALKSDEVTDVAPVRALPGLKRFTCSGTAFQSGRLIDLSPLNGLPLKVLEVPYNALADLSPLAGIPLDRLDVGMTAVKDVSPLRGMKLYQLNLWGCPVSDLSPLREVPLKNLGLGYSGVTDIKDLKGMRLENLSLCGTKVKDIRVLAGMPLQHLSIETSPIADLSPLRDVALKSINVDYDAARDKEVLKAIKTLEHVNGKTVAEFWKDSP